MANDICRGFYKAFRTTSGGPAMTVVVRLDGYFVYAEKDCMDGIVAKAHCAWCAKVKGLEKWSDLQEERKEKMNKCAEDKLKAFRLEIEKTNFSGTIMDDVWCEQLCQAAVDYLPKGILELDDEDDSGGAFVKAIEIVMEAFLKEQGYVRKQVKK